MEPAACFADFLTCDTSMSVTSLVSHQKDSFEIQYYFLRDECNVNVSKSLLQVTL